MAVTMVSVNMLDHSGEPTRTQFAVGELLADGTNWAAITASIDLLVAGLAVATSCIRVNTTISMEYNTGLGTIPITVTAQREIAIRVKFRDAVTGEFGFVTVPGPIVTFYPPTGVKGDYIPLDNVVFAAYIALMESDMVSRDGNAIEVVEGRLVGRNL